MDIEEIGSFIRNRRLLKNLSQLAVSERVRISRPNLSQLENGRLPEIGIRKVMEVLEQLGLELTIREAHARPTLQELAAQRNEYIHAMTDKPARKRAKRCLPSLPIINKDES